MIVGRIGRLALALAVVVGSGGCNLVFGLEPPSGNVADDAAPGDDGRAGDGPARDAAADARVCGDHDEDGDGVPDGCDNCPHVANTNQANVLDSAQDDVGDACDPRPNLPGDVLLRFDSFATIPTDMTLIVNGPGAGFDVAGDVLIDGDATVGADALARFPVPDSGRIVVVTRLAINNLIEPQQAETASAGVWAIIDGDGTAVTFPSGVFGEVGVAAGTVRQSLTQLVDTAGSRVQGLTPPEFGAGLDVTLTIKIAAVPFAQLQVTPSTGTTDQLMLTGGTRRAGDVGLRTHSVGATFRYLVVYGAAP